MKNISGKINKKKLIKIIVYFIVLIFTIVFMIYFNVMIPNIYQVSELNKNLYAGFWLVLVVFFALFLIFGFLQVYKHMINKRSDYIGS